MWIPPLDGKLWRAGIYFKASSLSVFPAVPGTGPLGCIAELTSAGDLWAQWRPPWSSPSVCFCLEECVFPPAAYVTCWRGWGFCVCRLYNFIYFKLLPDQPFSLTSETVSYRNLFWDGPSLRLCTWFWQWDLCTCQTADCHGVFRLRAM